MKQLLFFVGLCLAMFSFSGCEDDNPNPVNEEELITTLKMTMTPQGGGAEVVFQFQDLDGEGGNDGVYTTSPLAVGTRYDVAVEVLNETESPAENITEEVSEEAEEHQFFFVPTGLNLSFEYNDSDANGNPIGLSAIFETGEASSGQLQVTLIHEPEKSAAGVASGDITNANGETDVQVTFDVEIQ